MNLYDLANEYAALEEMLQLDGGEMTATHEQLEVYITEMLTTKVDGYVQFMQKLEDEVELGKKHIARIQAYKKARENAIENLREYAGFALKRMGKEKVTGEMGSISLRKPSKVLLIEKELEVPEDYCHYERVIDKAKLKEALKHDDISGARLIDGKSSVMIKLKGVKSE
jgi:hypothetical protein